MTIQSQSPAKTYKSWEMFHSNKYWNIIAIKEVFVSHYLCFLCVGMLL